MKKGYIENIEEATKENTNFRKTTHLQLSEGVTESIKQVFR